VISEAHPTDRCAKAADYAFANARYGADLLRAQAQSQCATATNWHDGQISQNLSSPSRKNILLSFSRKSSA
jgi:hypothetical protein